MDIAQIIKFEGDDKTLVWKSPIEDFNTGTQLIVHESQEAVLFRDGQALDSFGPGRHTLETQNIPLLKKLINLPTDDKTPFHCEVYYINTALALNVKWGTTSKFEVLDPKFFVQLNVGASGAMEIRIKDTRKFLIKVVGTQREITTDRIVEYFKEKIVVKVKTNLSKIMSEVSYVVINQHLEDISEALKQKLAEEMEDYGIELINFYLSTIFISEDEKKKVQDVLNKKMEQGMLGYNWMDEQIADIAKRYVSNPGNSASSNVAGMMAQMPVAMAFGQMLSGTAKPLMENGMNQFGSGLAKQGNLTAPNLSDPTKPAESATGFMTPTESSNKIFCTECGTALPVGTKFCSNCGTPVKVSAEIRCKNCNRKLEDNEKFCPECGTKRD